MREEWGSRAGFILATIGAAVGLGNIWRFAYIAGENGGAVFLFVYLLFVALIGLPLVIAELALGRRGASDAVAAFAASAAGSLWRHAGWIGVVAAVAILSYYAVVAGWALRYFAGALTGALWREAGAGYGAFFEGFIAGSAEPMLYQAVMLALAALVVAAGVKGGIERINLWIMPLLAAIVCGLAIHALLLPGSARGVGFLFTPDWSALGRPALYLNALGQAFFSLGVGMAVFVTYGGYLGSQTGIPRSAATVVIGDTAFALVAGLAVFPAVFALGGDPAAGPRLAFITFPQILLDMPAGRIVGTVFFLLLSAAALTSMISLLEVAVAVLVARTGWSRPRATAIVAAALFLLGMPSALGYGTLRGWTLAGQPLLDAIDHLVSNFLLPLSGLCIALFVGWRLRAAEAVSAADLAGSAVAPAWLWLLRIGAPLTILVILLRSAGLF
ncbi:MAG: sodium-dependent transporter [Alphaproteobacteria bacterium]|nr:sodium-dependent transporter [Alphaproteobacteria bacterium]